MELHLGLSLSTQNPIDACSLEISKKRCFEDAFVKLKDASKSEALPLLLWSGHPNDEDDENNRANKRISCRLNNKGEDDDHVVGWPPIKSWRKKALHHQQSGRILKNRVAGGGGGKENNSIYVKVKMEGVAIARKVDLRLFHSYQTLTNSLISMFSQCQLAEKDSTPNNYTLTYLDKDGDWLLAADVPWQTFTESVQRLELLRNGR
ncbi:auxin-responsive protein IAA29 [Jatropha curcas]|uniref:auxin-responsive protein IAA29 n=1 Tax=Jatropha curcas TaxID=180498 RepID=UPI0009D79371|nr:auxin-responsive protein IAA29 [Jatropha curcas]